jgi:hypothetical protein
MAEELKEIHEAFMPEGDAEEDAALKTVASAYFNYEVFFTG